MAQAKLTTMRTIVTKERNNRINTECDEETSRTTTNKHTSKVCARDLCLSIKFLVCSSVYCTRILYKI